MIEIHLVEKSDETSKQRVLDLTLYFIENAACASEIAGKVMTALIDECFGTQNNKIKNIARKITKKFIEKGQQDATVKALVGGMDSPTQKIRSTCVNVLTSSLKNFGNEVIDVYHFVDKLPELLVDGDFNMRHETKQLTIQIYK